jgi:copper chaperone
MAQATYTFTVEGMHCSSCGMLIDETLEEIDGVLSAATSMRTGKAQVDLDPSRCAPEDVISAIHAAGYSARLDG